MSGEHLLILGIVLLIFGPRRLPELGNTLGRGIRNFKDAISGVEEARFRKLEENAAAQTPLQSPLAAASTMSAPLASVPPTVTPANVAASAPATPVVTMTSTDKPANAASVV